MFGGGAQYSLPEQPNCTLIFLPKIVGERGGGGGGVHQKKFPEHTKKFYTNYENFCRTCISKNYIAYSISFFVLNQN